MTNSVFAERDSVNQASMRISTRTLLVSGVVGAPLFLSVMLVQILTRDGFDPRLHPLSLLSTGGLGWIQIINFIVAGVLFVACAVGMRRVLYPGRAGTWGPRLVGAYGVSLIWSGVFVADPYRGFPPGTAEPDQMSWHSALHTIGPLTAYLALLVACAVFARRFSALRQHGWMAYTIATAVVAFVAANVAIPADDFRIMLGGGALVWTWASVLALHLLRHQPIIQGAGTGAGQPPMPRRESRPR